MSKLGYWVLITITFFSAFYHSLVDSDLLRIGILAILCAIFSVGLDLKNNYEQNSESKK